MGLGTFGYRTRRNSAGAMGPDARPGSPATVVMVTTRPLTRALLPVLLVLLVLLTGACSAGGASGDDAGDSADTTEPGGSLPSPTTEPPGDIPSLDPGATAGSPVCASVRQGIDAFNEGDYEATVALFAEALPLADAAATEPDASAEARLLAGAVRYYAELAPQEYPEAAQGDADFETNKQITLGLCVTEVTPLAPPSGGGPGEPGAEA